LEELQIKNKAHTRKNSKEIVKKLKIIDQSKKKANKKR